MKIGGIGKKLLMNGGKEGKSHLDHNNTDDEVFWGTKNYGTHAFYSMHGVRSQHGSVAAVNITRASLELLVAVRLVYD